MNIYNVKHDLNCCIRHDCKNCSYENQTRCRVLLETDASNMINKQCEKLKTADKIDMEHYTAYKTFAEDLFNCAYGLCGRCKFQGQRKCENLVQRNVYAALLTLSKGM